VVLWVWDYSPSSFAHLYSHFPTMVTISICECVAIICYLKSLETLLVSYAIAVSVWLGSCHHFCKTNNQSSFVAVWVSSGFTTVANKDPKQEMYTVLGLVQDQT
jgi:hypothetical protein